MGTIWDKLNNFERDQRILVQVEKRSISIINITRVEVENDWLVKKLSGDEVGTWQRYGDTDDKSDGVDTVYKRILPIIRVN